MAERKEMGRILIYTLAGDSACARAKELLVQKQRTTGTALVEINLTDYPKRSREMKRLTGKRSVPQIFFNSLHVGGAAELQALEKSNKLDEMLEKVAKEEAPPTPLPPSDKDKLVAKALIKTVSGGSPAKRRGTGTGKESTEVVPLAVSGGSGSNDEPLAGAGTGSPSSSSVLSTSSSPATDAVQSDRSEDDLSDDEITGEGEEVLHGSHYLEAPDEAEIEEMDALFDQLRQGDAGLKRRDIGSFNKVKDCFRAFEVVMWLMTRLGIEEEVAVRVGQQLLRLGYIYRARDGGDEPFANSTDIFKFAVDDDPNVLNTRRRWKHRPRPPLEVAQALEDRLRTLLDAYVSPDGRLVDYPGLAMSVDFHNYTNTVLELQTLDLSGVSEPQLKAFFINIYNGIALHGLAVLGSPSTPGERAAFFDELAYIVAGQRYSLYDIKHGILRGNRKPPGVAVRRFSKSDPRVEWTIRELDPRIHFALVCGTRSCSRLRVYPTRPYSVPADSALVARHPHLFSTEAAASNSTTVDIDKELTMATEESIAETTSIVFELRQVLIARTFGWFHDDFGANDKDLLSWIIPYLRDPALQADLVECLNDLQFEVRCGHWNFDLNVWERPVLDVVSDKGPLILSCPGFRRELGSERTAAIRLFGQEIGANETHLYRTHFHSRPHTNFMCKDSDEGAVVICVARDDVEAEHGTAAPPPQVAQRKKAGAKPLKKYRVLIRTPKADTQIVLSASGQKELFESLRAVYTFADKRTLVPIEDPKFCEDLLSLDDTLLYTEYKFGVLYYKDGQTNEDDMFGNVDTSPEYEAFLQMLGQKVRLQGWKQYAAGLDTEKNQTGTHSIFTTWDNHEIMFHVSTMLPYSKKDSQQIERKRHLGNDAVLIVFHDGATPFQPQCITSKYSQIYMVVQAIKQEGGETMYRLGVASREDVPEYGPPLPNPPVFPAGSQARDFIFKKMVSGLRASMKGPDFAKRIAHSRGLALNSYAEKYLN